MPDSLNLLFRTGFDSVGRNLVVDVDSFSSSFLYSDLSPSPSSPGIDF